MKCILRICYIKNICKQVLYSYQYIKLCKMVQKWFKNDFKSILQSLYIRSDTTFVWEYASNWSPQENIIYIKSNISNVDNFLILFPKQIRTLHVTLKEQPHDFEDFLYQFVFTGTCISLRNSRAEECQTFRYNTYQYQRSGLVVNSCAG